MTMSKLFVYKKGEHNPRLGSLQLSRLEIFYLRDKYLTKTKISRKVQAIGLDG